MAILFNYNALPGSESLRAKRPARVHTNFTIDQVAPAPFLPVSMTMIAEQARLDAPIETGTVTNQDSLYEIYIGVAVNWIERHLCQPILRTAWVQTQDAFTTLPVGGVRKLLGVSLRRLPFLGTTPSMELFLQEDPTTAVPVASADFYVSGDSLVLKESSGLINANLRDVGGIRISFQAGYVDWPTYPAAPTPAEIDAARLKVKPEDVFAIASLVSLMDTQREGSQEDIKYQATAKLQGLTPAQIRLILGHRKPPSVTGRLFGGRAGRAGV